MIAKVDGVDCGRDFARRIKPALINGLVIVAGVGTLGLTASEADTVQAAIARHEAQHRQAKDAALEAAIPGVLEAVRLSALAYNESECYSREFGRMMEDESNDGARPPRAEDTGNRTRLTTIIGANPRVALYLRALSQSESTHWADNTGKGAAAKRAMGILVSGGNLDDARAALDVRRDVID